MSLPVRRSMAVSALSSLALVSLVAAPASSAPQGGADSGLRDSVRAARRELRVLARELKDATP
jgi:hypothetical protein